MSRLNGMSGRRAVAGCDVASYVMACSCVAMCGVAMCRVAVPQEAVPRVTMSRVQMASVAVRAARMAVTPESTQRHGGEARGAQQQTRDVEVHRRERV